MSAAQLKTRIKICGITSVVDARAVFEAGAHALGLAFTDQSPRCIPVDLAAEISAEVSGDLLRVGLFVDPAEQEVAAVLSRVDLDVLQFNGEESSTFCASFGLPYIKAVRVRQDVDGEDLARRYPDACALLLDTFVEGRAGGTGKRFDLNHWPEAGEKPLVLAGGLTPDNVAAAIAEVQPYAVDVSGGVEGPRKGLKDAEKIRKFVGEVNRARIK